MTPSRRKWPMCGSWLRVRAIACAALTAPLPLAADVHSAASTSAASTPAASTSAATGENASESAAVVVAGRAITLGQLQAIVNRSAPERLRTNRELRQWIQDEVVPELRLDHHAHTALAKDERYSTVYNEALTQALEQSMLTSALGTSTELEEISAYYQQFRDRFQQPEAVLVWRILVPTQEQADKLRQQVVTSKKSTDTWKQLAREHSLDEATRMRGGNLGFVHADGKTDVPQVRVARVLFETAAKLRDGDVAPQAVAEGKHWALVWRRGTRKAESTSLEQARPEIEQHLALHRARGNRLRLLERLRSLHLREHTPDLLEAIQYPSEQGIPSARVSTQAKPAEQNPQPQQTDRGER